MGTGINVLIGYTGFIGSSLNQDYFDLKISSKDWDSISDNSISADEIIITAPSGLKWKANKEPEKDLKNIEELLINIKNKFKSIGRVILISSNDAILKTSEYGKNRSYFYIQLQDYCLSNNISFYAFFLGMTFGVKAKKGMIYDFLNGNFDYYKGGVYQLYPVSRLAKDIRYCVEHNIHIALLCSEPIQTKEIKTLFGVEDSYESAEEYSLTKLGLDLISKEEILEEIKWMLTH